jgi:hypothetical protein
VVINDKGGEIISKDMTEGGEVKSDKERKGSIKI